jgi:nucleoside-diphosphate-sugar epimerase
MQSSDDRPRFLVTGAAGFVGRHLVAELRARGFPVRQVVRNVSGFSKADDVVAVADIAGDVDWTSALKDVNVVVHLAARAHRLRDESGDPLSAFRRVNVEATKRLAQAAAAARIGRFVYVSTIGVHGDRSVATPTTEHAPIAPHDDYTLSKAEAEAALNDIAARTGLSTVILRPCLVYGADAPGNVARLLRWAGSGVPLPLASISNQRSLLFVRNFVDALIASALHPDAVGRVYVVSDNERTSTPMLISRLAQALDRPARIVPFPVALLRLAGRLIGRSKDVSRLVDSLAVESSTIRRELSWRPPYSLQEGIEQTAQWFKKNKIEKA